MLRSRPVLKGRIAAIFAATLAAAAALAGQSPQSIPEFWSAELLHDYELPLASPAHSPVHVSRDYYCALPERVLYKSYPIYHPDREPAGYIDRLRTVEAERVFDAAALATDADWVAAGRLVFEMPIDYGNPIVDLAAVRDPQFYALGRFLFADAAAQSNRPDDRSRRGEAVFAASGCARCHTPPLYTANKLVPAEGFAPPADHVQRYDILDARVGTDATLATKTRRGTGYYKIPSLKGVWYRGPFEHSGSVATLEDWFDPRRLRDDYMPTGLRVSASPRGP